MKPEVEWAVWSRERAQRVEDVLDRVLPPADQAPAQLHAAMRYSVLGGGKRIRALLAYASGELHGANVDTVDHAAAAVELIHAYSLIHDDLPCMDDDVLRRGKPTCHVAFGEATALLAGDALQSLAFATIAATGVASSSAMCALLAHASGSRGMAGGQSLDLDNTGKTLTLAELEHMHSLKTGALIRASILLGAHCGDALQSGDTSALDRFAAAAGLGFQVVDDVLDVEGSAATLGKTAGKDALQAKPTYVSLLGLSTAKQRVAELRSDAHAALAGFGPNARRLLELADWIAARTH
jgi:farnesyl diphosphate synthase